MSEFEEQPQVEAEEAPVAEEPQQPAKTWGDEDEAEAKLFGWKAPEEWQGDKPPGYIDNPTDYLDRVKRSRIFQTMEEKMADQERKLAVMSERALERQRQEYESRMQAITQQQRRAVEEADTETWDKLEQHRQHMLRQQPQPEQPQGPAREVVEYQQQHDWAKDPVLWQEAVQAVNYGLQSGALQTPDPKAQLEFAERTMRAKYPHLFQTQKTPRQRVDGGGLASGPASGRSSFDKLPSEAKTAFERFVKQGVFEDTKKDREEYARDYNAA